LDLKPKYTAIKTYPVPGFADIEVVPTTAWNYGLFIDTEHIERSISVNTSAIPDNPFASGSSPVKLSLKAQKLPGWTISPNPLYANEVPVSPVSSKEQVETVSLIPYGTENIRISSFPVIGKPESYKSLKDDFSSGSLNKWIQYGGAWHIKDGILNCSANSGTNINGTKLVAESALFSNLNYTADIKLNSKSNAGITFRVNNSVLGADAYQGYYAAVDASTGNVVLGKSSQKWIELKTSAQDIKTGINYKLRVLAVGPQIKVYLNQQADPVITFTDTEYTSGGIGLRAYNCAAGFDEITVAAVN
ncbi:MAG: DUF1080 domain-containing protein, partial [Sphingobacteriaceae bacterium]